MKWDMLNIQHLMWRWKNQLTSRLQHRFTHYPLSIYMREALSDNMALNSPRDPLNWDSGENGSYHDMEMWRLLLLYSAGCGRTGVICAVDYVNDLLLTEVLTSYPIHIYVYSAWMCEAYGMFIYIYRLIKRITYALFYPQQIQEDFNILDLVLELRRQRPSAVQTKVTS